MSRFLLLASLAIAPAALADNVLYVDPVFQVANSGATVSFGVRIDAATDITGIWFDLRYNPALASLVSVGPGELSWDDSELGSDDTLGRISGIFGLVFGAPFSTTSGLLATFQFMMYAPGIANFDIENVLMTDDLGLAVVTGDPVGGSVQVNAPPAIPEPSTYVMSATALLGLLALRRRRN